MNGLSQRDTVELPVSDLAGEPPSAPSSARIHVETAAESHQGLVRPNNEDSFLVVRAERGMHLLHSNLPDGIVPERHQDASYGLMVADGMGGSAAGEVASRTAIGAYVRMVLDAPTWFMRAREEEAEPLLQRIIERFRQVDATLRAQAAANPRWHGMGTTLTLAYLLGPDLVLTHIGDSRAYLLRGDRLHQLTRDQTMAQAMADMGMIRPDEVATHRLRHVLTNVLGGAEGQVKVEVERVPLRDGDQILLCSDGLTEMVDDDTIAKVLHDSGTAEAACHALIEKALANGGRDNVTVALARYGVLVEEAP